MARQSSSGGELETSYEQLREQVAQSEARHREELAQSEARHQQQMADVMTSVRDMINQISQGARDVSTQVDSSNRVYTHAYKHGSKQVCSRVSKNATIGSGSVAAVKNVALGMVYSRGYKNAAIDPLGPVAAWHRLGLNGLGPTVVELAHFMAISWNLWNSENGIRRGDVPKSVTNIILEATRLIAEFQAVQDHPKLQAIPLHTRWKPPRPGVYKANVDGAIFKNQLIASLGVLIRDPDGQVVGALSQQIHAPLGVLEAEAKAMEAAVVFARDVGIQEIIFKADSLQVCNFLKGGFLTPLAVAKVLEGILYHLQAFHSFEFSHKKGWAIGLPIL
ncbi:hypothetical protein SO802_020027 [Lithocarpus litseifolius]|uniref:RNase H type-1 domain-containing protein n=1 Tax=Lithocarpus litseifolius TaxID=425828 RepID=A0AAW2CAK5_9ROSI